MTDTDRLANANPAAVSLTGMAAGTCFSSVLDRRHSICCIITHCQWLVPLGER